MDADLLEQLHAPETFPGVVSAVEVIQTHLSVVCLVGETAYKLKKPVHLPFVDFSSLETRRQSCEDEVRLNSRLCPWVYRGVRPIYRTGDGAIRFEGNENAGDLVIEYAVEMARLPEARMMNRLLANDDVEVESVREIAECMAQFHEGADRGGAVASAGDPEKLRGFALANFEETRGLVGDGFDDSLHALLEKRTGCDFDRWMPLLRKRAAEGRIVDGHGDLHARNICLDDPVAIYDCIEFNRELRCGDTATENAFLVMDLRYRGHPNLAREYLAAYIEASGDEAQRELMPILVRYRLMVRAKVAAIAAGEPELSSKKRSESACSAGRHFHRVAASFIEEEGPWLIIASGLPGTGKSTIFGKLAEQAGWRSFSSDRIRKDLAGVPAGHALPEAAYTPQASQAVYREMLARAASELERCPVVLVDANFRTCAERRRAREVAEAAGARLAVIHVTTPESEILARLSERESSGASDSDATTAVYETLRSQFEVPNATENDRLIEAAGNGPPSEAVSVILTALLDEG